MTNPFICKITEHYINQFSNPLGQSVTMRDLLIGITTDVQVLKFTNSGGLRKVIKDNCFIPMYPMPGTSRGRACHQGPISKLHMLKDTSTYDPIAVIEHVQMNIINT